VLLVSFVKKQIGNVGVLIAFGPRARVDYSSAAASTFDRELLIGGELGDASTSAASRATVTVLVNLTFPILQGSAVGSGDIDVGHRADTVA
jgi:hypothetical protein